MGAPETLPDVQGMLADFGFTIDQVGVKSVKFPLQVASADGGAQATVATLDMYVALPPTQKGTHMSRFLEQLHAHQGPLDGRALHGFVRDMAQRLNADAAEVSLRFPYFVRKTAPVSGAVSLLDVEAAMRGEWRADRGWTLTLTVTTPVTSLCPCSKKISAYGAHNQRSHITLSATLRGDLGLRELVRMAEEEASCEVFGLLKRPDEKWVTERAYDNPKFVEDMVRDVAGQLNREPRIDAYVVESENFESIHNHSAYALIERDKRHGA